MGDVALGWRLDMRVEGQRDTFRHAQMRIAIHQFVIFKPEGNPHLGHQPQDEVQVAFALLGHVLTRWIGLLELALVRDAVFIQYLVDDVRHRQEMEDPAVLFQAQYPDIRADHRLIVGTAKTAFP